MLTKRDKILVRPWEQRKYENHLRKVQTALPVIDNKPPVSREHVSIKLKKRQNELERIRRIENENLILLRKMNYIMKTNRVDNCWSKPPPNFLNRVSIYNKPLTGGYEMDDDFEIHAPVIMNHLRKAKCTACSPQKVQKINLPEERVPWSPPKPPVAKVRSRSVPARKNSLPIIMEDHKRRPDKPKSSNESRRLPERPLKKHKSFEDCYTSPQRLVLTRGSLKLCVNFPSDAQIKLQDGPTEKVLMRTTCSCRY